MLNNAETSKSTAGTFVPGFGDPTDSGWELFQRLAIRLSPGTQKCRSAKIDSLVPNALRFTCTCNLQCSLAEHHSPFDDGASRVG